MDANSFFPTSPFLFSAIYLLPPLVVISVWQASLCYRFALRNSRTCYRSSDTSGAVMLSSPPFSKIEALLVTFHRQ